ncbi:MAG: GntG family PLP-dependent aldolase [Planctomycetota bacterium]
MAIPLRIDFRSDTVTRPTAAMRQAMAEAVVGDDVFGDDATANKLEARAAELFGKEAAVFFPSGTMANLAAILAQCAPGEEALLEEHTHTYRYEQGGAARFGGVSLRGLPGDAAGRLSVRQIEDNAIAGPGLPAAVRLHCSRTALLVIENTHNFAGGRVQPQALVEALGASCHERGMRLHLDGARIMNAAVATGLAPAALAGPADTVMCCVSKGLCAPIGSVLAGEGATMDRARQIRKALGGGMRQVGVIAAPALLALDSMVQRLATDHANARRLATGLATIVGLSVDPAAVETNILFARLEGGAPAHRALAESLAERGIGVSPVGSLGVRFVTHRDVNEGDIDKTLEAIRELVPSLAPVGANA